MAQYFIPEENMIKLERKLLHIRNKCKKLGISFLYEILGDTYKEVSDSDGFKYMHRFVHINVEGSVYFGGWRFVGTLESTPNGNIVRLIEDVSIPMYFLNSKITCDHCKITRTRSSTYLLVDDSGSVKQVGKSCLKEFTGGLDATTISFLSSFIEHIHSYESCSSSKVSYYYDKVTILSYIYETIRHFGYVKSEHGVYSTVERALDYYYVHSNFKVNSKLAERLLNEMHEVGFDITSDETQTTVKSALAWINSTEPSSNYLHNLKVVCTLAYVKHNHFTILASLFPAYMRDLKYKEEQQRIIAQSVSEYQGAIGDRLTFKIKEHSLLTSWQTDWGYTRLYKFVDMSDNYYIWTTTSFIDKEFVEVVGTVKSHKEFRGVKQTELTRCKLR